MHPSMNSLARFTAHQPTIDGMHSAGMQPEGAGGFSTERRIPPGCNFAEAFFVGLSFGRDYILQADKQKEMTN
jgi:hypothetical protein